jgi:hypothetical protein
VLALKEWYGKRTALQKAMSKSETPPKAKYIRRLVLSSWKHSGAGAGAVSFRISAWKPCMQDLKGTGAAV